MMLLLVLPVLCAVYLVPAALVLAYLPNWRWFVPASVLVAAAFWFLLPPGHIPLGGGPGEGGAIVAGMFDGVIQFLCWTGLAIIVASKAASLRRG